jgi:hypothetical protein
MRAQIAENVRGGRLRGPGGRRGTAAVEFALVSTFLVPLFVGSCVVGINLSRSIQATQISRDLGHMYARQVDLASSNGKDLAVRLASGTGITKTGGTGVIILSKMLKVSQSECDGAALTAAQCSNLNRTVIVNRIVIGATALRSSAVGTPATTPDSQGNVPNYLTDITARSNSFDTILTLTGGEVAYVCEVYADSPDLNFQHYQTNTGVYARSIF